MPPDAPGPLLRVEGICRRYPAARFQRGRASVEALRDVSLQLERGRMLGIVGPSGSGKSTLARCLSLADRPDSGQIFFEGHDLWTTADRRALHARIQLIPQQPAASLNPRFMAVEIVAEPLAIQRRGDPAKRRELAERWMAAVGGRTPWSAADGDTGGETDRPANCTGGKTAGGTEAVGGRTPWSAAGPLAGRQRGESGGSASGTNRTGGKTAGGTDRPALEFSGGERQRLAIARALILEPALLILDESFAGLDLPVQGQIVRLLRDLLRAGTLACILITHDLALAAGLADEIAVMDAGRIVESGPAGRIVAAPQHPRTRELLAAALALSLPEPAA